MTTDDDIPPVMPGKKLGTIIGNFIPIDETQEMAELEATVKFLDKRCAEIMQEAVTAVKALSAECARADRLEAQVDQIGGIVLEAMRHLQIGMDGCGGQLWVGEHVVDAIKTLSGALKIARAALAAREGEE